MTSNRIKEIQQETAYPESVSVKQALLKVWNECEQVKPLHIPCCSPTKDIKETMSVGRICNIIIKRIENFKLGTVHYECDGETFMPINEEQDTFEFSYFAFETEYCLNDGIIDKIILN